MGRGVALLVSLEDKTRRELLKGVTANGGWALERAEATHRRDPDVVLAAVANHPGAILRADEELRSDLTFAHEVVRKNWRTLEHLPQSLRSNRDLALAAAHQHPSALELASREAKEDPGLIAALREIYKISKSGERALGYEGECLRLVGYCNEWRTSDSRLRFQRVLPGQFKSGQQRGNGEQPEPPKSEGAGGPEAADSNTGGEGGEARGAGEPPQPSLSSDVNDDVPPGVSRHHLAAHLSHGFLSFQVLSCIHLFAHRICPRAGGQDGFFVLGRGKSNAGVTAGWGVDRDDGHGFNFYIAEMADTIVNIYVDIYDGLEHQSATVGLPRVEVWYEVETGMPSGELVSLSQVADKQKPKLPKRHATLCTLVQDTLAANDVRILVDPEANKKYNDLVMEARNLSKSNYDQRFYIRDIAGSRHLALLVDPACSRTFGYCLYTMSTATGELQIEQLVVSESLRGTLVAWVSSQADSAQLSLVEKQGETKSDGKVPLSEVRRRAAMTDPEYPAFIVDANKGAELWETEEGREGSAYIVLKKGVPVFGVVRQGLVQVMWPVPGCFVDRVRLTEVQRDATVKRRSLAAAELAAVMHRTRLDVTGPNPRGQCVVSSHELCKDIVAHGIDRHLGEGPCRVMEGSFHAKAEGLGNWERHWFVMFGNGTIADVTADQFDDVIKLWWPADASRYALWVGDQHIPLTTIELGKVGKGIKWATNALGWAPV